MLQVQGPADRSAFWRDMQQARELEDADLDVVCRAAEDGQPPFGGEIFTYVRSQGGNARNIPMHDPSQPHPRPRGASQIVADPSKQPPADIDLSNDVGADIARLVDESADALIPHRVPILAPA